MKYAVVETGGKQYKIEEGKIFDIEKIVENSGTEFTFDKILLFCDEGKVVLGHPYLADVAVTATVLEQKKGIKIRVAKFKAKSRYRKVQGHRQLLTTVQIAAITQKQANPGRSEEKETVKVKKESSQVEKSQSTVESEK